MVRPTGHHQTRNVQAGGGPCINVRTSVWRVDYQPMAVFVLVAGIYFVMSYPLSLLVRAMERRLRIAT